MRLAHASWQKWTQVPKKPQKRINVRLLKMGKFIQQITFLTETITFFFRRLPAPLADQSMKVLLSAFSADNFYLIGITEERFSLTFCLPERDFWTRLNFFRNRLKCFGLEILSPLLVAACKYWLINQGQGWTFGTEKFTLAKHANTGIKRHVKVKSTASPYDGNWTYWSQSKGSYPGISQTVASALKRQKGKCLECGLYFQPEDQVEIHHLDGDYQNRRKENLTALHRHCHDQTHGKTGSLSAQLSTYVKGQLGEEPDERKLSRPVLKPSRVGTTRLKSTVLNPNFW